MSTAAQLLRIPEVAPRLALSVRAVWRLIAGGKLRVVRAGPGSTRVRASEVERFVRSLREGR